MSHLNLNTLVLGRRRTDLSNGAYAVELECRLPALMKLYQTQCRVPLNTDNFGTDIRSLISRNGHVHYVLGADDTILGFATVLSSHTLVENTFPVDRFIVDAALPHDVRQAVAMQLIESIVGQARAELPNRHDDIWIRVSFPTGADADTNQPIYAALEQNGFQASRTAGMVSWTVWIQHTRGVASEAA